MPEPVLCYVDRQWAFFTTQELSKQWGDDWNDAPYEHNAEMPYEWHDRDPNEPWEIIRVAWVGPYEQPCDGYRNSPWSVEQINRKAVAWFVPSIGTAEPIFAGTTLTDFCRMMKAAGGSVYLKQE